MVSLLYAYSQELVNILGSPKMTAELIHWAVAAGNRLAAL